MKCQHCGQESRQIEMIWGESICRPCEDKMAVALGAIDDVERFIVHNDYLVYFAICAGCGQRTESSDTESAAISLAFLENWKIESIGEEQYIYCPSCQVKRMEGLSR